MAEPHRNGRMKAANYMAVLLMNPTNPHMNVVPPCFAGTCKLETAVGASHAGFVLRPRLMAVSAVSSHIKHMSSYAKVSSTCYTLQMQQVPDIVAYMGTYPFSLFCPTILFHPETMTIRPYFVPQTISSIAIFIIVVVALTPTEMQMLVPENELPTPLR
jgi:hypothetical protein